MHRIYQQYSPNESPPSYYDIDQIPSDLTKKIDEEATPPSYRSYLQQINFRHIEPDDYGDNDVETEGRPKPKYFESIVLVFGLVLNCILLPAAMTLIGYFSLEKCMAEPKLPGLLILYAISKFLFYFGFLFDVITKLVNKNANLTRSNTRKFITYVLFGLLFVCFLNGNVFAYKKSDDLKSCLSHMFLFWYINIIWALVVLLVIGCIIASFSHRLFSFFHSDQ